VVIVSDDVPYWRLRTTGATTVPTPHIDSIFEHGVFFNSGYVSAPVCAPSRAGILTGRYQSRYGYESITTGIKNMAKFDIGVDTREILLPRLLQRQGYATAVIGKWHLGYNDKYHPNNRGADYFFGILARGGYYWEEERARVLRNMEPIKGEGYLTEVFAGEAVEFIRRNRDRPFFLYFAPRNVHIPYVVPAEYIPPGGDVMDGMIRALDESVGRILETLEQEGLAEDTLVVYVNDNGGEGGNHPFRGGKSSLHEGGIRVPFAMRWPGRFPEGSTYDHPVIQLDILPTALAAAGGALPDDREYDGVDLVPYLTGAKAGPPHEELYWRFVDGERIHYAVRAGDLKLVVLQGADGATEQVGLYDLVADPREATDLALQRSEDVERLQGLLRAWERHVKDSGQYGLPPG
jgi:arylsulfatase A-like enzyme